MFVYSYITEMHKMFMKTRSEYYYYSNWYLPSEYYYYSNWYLPSEYYYFSNWYLPSEYYYYSNWYLPSYGNFLFLLYQLTKHNWIQDNIQLL